ncbi:Calcineurin-like phosphoesterase [Halogranum gelatinilyticum]|uniref:Calcineurin-like phosphoesterase n=1 Tax=Halogranum gelatinilyticum TaxID=660521 RepID=A0A1G9T732_9EURY|nr:5'-nucleotidase C-terminal domain-containing protein [Halogranum gelatinilyticum]SDM43491.1 Calcineurin-like phosphoesterase [Halogranum gelatinilyticum]
MPRFLHYSDIENVYDDPERAGRLAGTITELDGDDALVVGTGDNTSPGVVAMVAKGHQALDFFRAVDADLATFGNHDFDYGPDETRTLLADAPQTWVSANVFDEDGEPFGAAEGVVPWTVEQVDGARVGFFGVTDPATDSLNPSAAELTLSDPYEAAESAVADLRAEGVDYVVALSHLGGGDDELAERVDVDVILGGHVHSERAEYVNDTLLTRPGVNGEVVLEVTLDADGARVERHDATQGPETPELADALRARVAAAGLDEVVATVDEPIPRDADVVHGGECRVGNFVADAYRWAADSDVALQNSGGLRAGPPLAGDVTIADLVSVVPFEEPVAVAEVTGAELLDAFRQMSSAVVDFGEDGWWHGHVSGARIVWDDDAAELLEATVGGEPVDPERLYTVAMAEYLLHSDHEFPAIEERHRAGEFGIQHDVLADYAREFGIDSAVEGRIERRSSAAGSATTATSASQTE